MTTPLSLQLGQWAQPTKEERIAQNLAKEYHIKTEAYDRSVCTGTITQRGCIMPANAHERQLINQNALLVSSQIRRKADCYGVSWALLHEAIIDHRNQQR